MHTLTTTPRSRAAPTIPAQVPATPYPSLQHSKTILGLLPRLDELVPLAPLIDFSTIRNGPGDRFRGLYIKIQQAEEKIHADFFQRYTKEVFGGDDARLSQLGEQYCHAHDTFSAPFRKFFTERIPQTLGALRGAHTLPSATAREIAAIALYHFIAEGIVAETGYFGFRGYEAS